jgi:uncharacterized membrane protein
MPYRTPPTIDMPPVPHVDPRFALAVLVGVSAVQFAIAASWSGLALGAIGSVGGVYAYYRARPSASLTARGFSARAGDSRHRLR